MSISLKQTFFFMCLKYMYLLLCSVLISRSAKNAPHTPQISVLARWSIIYEVDSTFHSTRLKNTMSIVHDSYIQFGTGTQQLDADI